MLGEFGLTALIWAFVLALTLGALPLWGAWRGNDRLMATARPLAYGQLLLLSIAFAVLAYAFATQDLSLAYVAQNSNRDLPMRYRLSAVWGAHEGSLLLWAWLLAMWTAAVARFSRSLPTVFSSRVLAVMGLVSTGFIAFMLITSNPFGRLLPPPPQGADLNPLLQDPGLIIHPPMLYTGYVGMAVAFAFAVAGLMGGDMKRDWARWARPWTTLAWVFLTAGIALGSWWAYAELGWGGWWFWDPVENASFMPWLAATALLHSQAVTQKRGAFKAWTVLLAIGAFGLSLLGTFLVRSGVLASVHAFASDPQRGIFVLALLGVVIGAALSLYTWRAPQMSPGSPFRGFSRESLLLSNNLFFATATAMVFLGTLYPLLMDALNQGKISVGSPYFGPLFTAIMAPAMVLMALAPSTRWFHDQFRGLLRVIGVGAAATAIALGFGWWLFGGLDVRTGLGLAAFAWIGTGTVSHAWSRYRNSGKLTPSVLAVTIAHLGVAVFALGVSVTESHSAHKDLSLQPGQHYQYAGYDFEFKGVEEIQGPNYTSSRGHFKVSYQQRPLTDLYPEKRRYPTTQQVMTEAAIDAGLWRDLYIAMGEPLQDGAWAVRIYYKPLIRWIWGGALLMLLGGLVGLGDRRYRKST